MPSQTNLFANEVPQMPEGYYSGDKPNPNLKAFVEAHLDENPYDPETDDYDVPAFDKPINTTKATAIYNMHTYWSKKPHSAIRQYIQHYTKPGDLVLDPFCGSGGTALAALMDGRKAVAIDRSPAATFITKNYCTPVNLSNLEASFDLLKLSIKEEIDRLYETKCDRCDGKALTAYTVYSQTFQCPRCLTKVPLFDCVEVQSQTAKGKPKKIKVCPCCHQKGFVEEIKTRSQKFGEIPVLVSYLCQEGCKPQRGQREHKDQNPKKREYFEKYDLGKIEEIQQHNIPQWYPVNRMMNVPKSQKRWGVKWRAGTSNFETVSEIFTKRNLWALSLIREKASEIEGDFHDLALLALTGSMLHLSKMSHHKEGGGGIMVGTYYLPQIYKERNTLVNYTDKLKEITKAFEAGIVSINQPVCISTQTATDLSSIPNSSLDYIFTDPPYADKVQYGELNFVWEAWLKQDTYWHDEEIIINEVRGKTESDWSEMMKFAMSECFRILKPGRWLSLCYHDTSEGTWSLIQDIMAEVGFVVDKGSDEALFIDTGQKSYNQLTADKVNKRDLVINFRKPKPGEVAQDIALVGDEDSTTFNDKVRTIIRDYLSVNPGSTKDRIYDELVSRMVRSGQMEAHNFDELLQQVAEPQGTSVDSTHEIRRWYLKETEITVMDEAESDKEEGAAKKVGDFIAKWLEQNPAEEGVHYSDLFEHYIYAVPLQDKPRRRLQDWLLDYFYKTPSGTYRLPITEEEAEAKTKARAAGTNRRIKRFLSYLEQGLAVPEREMPNDATLAEWIRHCKRSSLYENGKYLYEQGGLNLENLSEELMVEVEEDYQVCVRMILRNESAAASKSTKGKKKS